MSKKPNVAKPNTTTNPQPQVAPTVDEALTTEQRDKLYQSIVPVLCKVLGRTGATFRTYVPNTKPKVVEFERFVPYMDMTARKFTDLQDTGEQRKFNDYKNSAVKPDGKLEGKTSEEAFEHWNKEIWGVEVKATGGGRKPKSFREHAEEIILEAQWIKVHGVSERDARKRLKDMDPESAWTELCRIESIRALRKRGLSDEEIAAKATPEKVSESLPKYMGKHEDDIARKATELEAAATRNEAEVTDVDDIVADW